MTVPLGLSDSSVQRQAPHFFPAVAPVWEVEEAEVGGLTGRLISSGRKRNAMSSRLSFLMLLLPFVWLLLMLLLLLLTLWWYWSCFFSQSRGEDTETEKVPPTSPRPPRSAPNPTLCGDDRDLIMKQGANASFSPTPPPPPLPFLSFRPPTHPPSSLATSSKCL